MNQHQKSEKNGIGQRSSAGNAELSVSDIVDLSALELSKAIKNKEVSCVEVMKAYLSRIEDVNPIHNAIVSLRDQEELLSEAGQKDAKLEKGIYHGGF